MQGDVLNTIPAFGMGNSDQSNVGSSPVYAGLYSKPVQDTFSCNAAQVRFGQTAQASWLQHIPPSLRQYLPRQQTLKQSVPKRKKPPWIVTLVGAVGVVGGFIFFLKKGHLRSSTKNTNSNTTPSNHTTPTVNSPPGKPPGAAPKTPANPVAPKTTSPTHTTPTVNSPPGNSSAAVPKTPANPAAPTPNPSSKVKAKTVLSINTLRDWLTNRNVPADLDSYDFSKLGSEINKLYNFGLKIPNDFGKSGFSTEHSILELATIRFQPDLVRKVLEAGAKIDVVSNYYKTNHRNLLNHILSDYRLSTKASYVPTISELLKKHPELMLERDGVFGNTSLQSAAHCTFNETYDPQGKTYMTVITTMHDILNQTQQGKKIWQDALAQKNRDGLTAYQIASNVEAKTGKKFPQNIINLLQAQ